MLNLQMIKQVIIHYSHLLKKFEHHLFHVVFFVDDNEWFCELFAIVFSLDTFHFKNVECDFAHRNGIEFGRPWICCFSYEASGVSFVVCLALDYFTCIMLVKLWIHIIKVNSVNVELIHILCIRIASGDSNVPKCLESCIRLICNTWLPILAIVSTIFNLQCPINDPIFHIKRSTIKIIKEARIIRLCYKKDKIDQNLHVLRLFTACSTVKPGRPLL